MDLKGMPNGFKPTKAPDEKLPFSKQQTVFELATASAKRLFMMRQVHQDKVVSGDNSNWKRGRGKDGYRN